MKTYLGVDCGSVSLNLVLLSDRGGEPLTLYRRTGGRPLSELVTALQGLREAVGSDVIVDSVLVTGSGRGLLSQALGIPAINEISAHATGIYQLNPRVRTVIEIGGQDSKFITLESPAAGTSQMPRVPVFRMNEICAAGTGAFLDEQAERIGIDVEEFGSLALQSTSPAHIAGRCAVFAKTDMIHQAQEGTPLPDILLGLAFALARNYIATLIRGETLEPLVSLQGGVMSNEAVVHAFRSLLGLGGDEIVIPPHFKVMGAMGCALLAERGGADAPQSLDRLRDRAWKALNTVSSSSCFPPLAQFPGRTIPCAVKRPEMNGYRTPVILGLDIGSVSVKGVLVDGDGTIVRDKYYLSRSRTLETVEKILEDLLEDGPTPAAISVTGSGRYLVGRLLDADLIIDEISAQAAAALGYSPDVDTVVEIGGQDSKWIALENGHVKDFEMNRVCAAGTGSFLMAQAQRLGLTMGKEFSDAAFASRRPADLGTRCTVFMESDLVHHQNNGAASGDLAAGVCISIVQNYLDRVANNKPLGRRVLFLGGVAATPSVRAAFEQQTGHTFDIPDFFMVSGAFGAALKAGQRLRQGQIIPRSSGNPRLKRDRIQTQQFTCKGCTNRCQISRYRSDDRSIFQGGLCDRWEVESGGSRSGPESSSFDLRAALLEELAQSANGSREIVWGITRSPQFFEWFPFWSEFCSELGISLRISPRTDREQFQKGVRYLRVETCLPMKAMAGQMSALAEAGMKTIFHPSILTEQAMPGAEEVVEHCPYIQGSSLFYKGAFDVDWKEPVISFALDSDSFRREHLRFAASLGFSRSRAAQAYDRGMESLNDFNDRLRAEGRAFLDSLGQDERAFIVLGKPYHTADGFSNMNLASVFRRLGIKALPSDLYPLESHGEWRPDVPWKYQSNIIRVAREMANDPRLYPILITFFGCGPDPFTFRHVREALASKPLLVLEMDEHSSRAGMITRIEAFVEQIASPRLAGPSLRRADGEANSQPGPGFERVSQNLQRSDNRGTGSPSPCPSPSGRGDYSPGLVGSLSLWERVGVRVPFHTSAPNRATKLDKPRVLRQFLAPHSDPQSETGVQHQSLAMSSAQSANYSRSQRAEILYLPYMCEHAYGFAAAAQSVGIDARVLPPPDEESEKLGRPHMVGGECHPYALILGDYLKLSQREDPLDADRALFYVLGSDACRLGQFPVYIEKIRQQLGLSIAVISAVDEGLAAFGISERNRQRVYMRGWEGLNAYDVLLRAFLEIRAHARDKTAAEQTYGRCRDRLFQSLCNGTIRQGMEEMVHDLLSIPVEDPASRPTVSVTGDYYTRVVPYANNDVYREIESLGGTVWSPPTFSDSLKMATLRDLTWNLMNWRSREAAQKGFLYVLLAFSEFKVKGATTLRKLFDEPLDLLGRRMWKTASRCAETRLPSGITAPIATALHHLDNGANGILNLMTLNCSYGTVVTAALACALKARPEIPMLTLVYDGLKKTNERTRLEAFMEQVNDNFRTANGRDRAQSSRRLAASSSLRHPNTKLFQMD